MADRREIRTSRVVFISSLLRDLLTARYRPFIDLIRHFWEQICEYLPPRLHSLDLASFSIICESSFGAIVWAALARPLAGA